MDDFDYAGYLKRQEWKNYSLGHYPDIPPATRSRLILAFCAIMALGTIAGYLTGYFRISFLAATVVYFCLQFKACPLRCPQCHGPVVTRGEDSQEDGQDYQQFFHDCPKCRITWIDKKSIVSKD